MLCNMTVIIPLSEPAVLQGSLSFSFESKVSQLPLSLLLSSVLLSLSPSSTLFSTVAFALSTFIQTFLWGSLSLTAL